MNVSDIIPESKPVDLFTRNFNENSLMFSLSFLSLVAFSFRFRGVNRLLRSTLFFAKT